MNKKAIVVLRIILGLFFLIFGSNKFLGFMAFPPIPGDGGTLMGIYFTSGFLYIVGILEMLGGLIMLIGKFVQIGLIILFVVMTNAILFHVFHDIASVGAAAFGMVLILIQIFANKEKFSCLFKP